MLKVGDNIIGLYRCDDCLLTITEITTKSYVVYYHGDVKVCKSKMIDRTTGVRFVTLDQYSLELENRRQSLITELKGLPVDTFQSFSKLKKYIAKHVR